MKKAKFKEILKSAFKTLFQNNDSPHRIALGLSLGVFLGILPGTGPIASLVMASLLRVNKAAAVIGSLLTNTWLSLVLFFLSLKIGSVILGLDWHKVQGDWQLLLHDFRWKSLFSTSALDIVAPVLVGYLVIALIFGIFAYFLILIIKISKQHKKNTIENS